MKRPLTLRQSHKMHHACFLAFEALESRLITLKVELKMSRGKPGYGKHNANIRSFVRKYERALTNGREIARLISPWAP